MFAQLFSLLHACKIICALGKARRLKQAKEDAQAEVDEFRVEREAQFKAHEQNVSFLPITNDLKIIHAYPIES